MPFCSKRKKRDECTKEELKRTGIRTQVLKLFFHQCVRSEYSDQFRCRLALPIDRLSLVSNIRAQPKPCNLQLFEIDQGIKRSDGQSWKDRVDLPALTKKKNTTTRCGKKTSAKLFRNAPGLGLSLFFFFPQKTNWRPPALPPIPLPCSKATSCQYQWLLLLLLLPLSC